MVVIHSEGDEGTTNVEPAAFLNAAHSNSVGPDSEDAPVATAAAVEIKPAAAPAVANLTQFWGQQVAFNKIVAAGALKKRSDGNYGEAGGYIMGELLVVFFIHHLLMSLCV